MHRVLTVAQPGCLGVGLRLLVVHYLFSKWSNQSMQAWEKALRGQWETKKRTGLPSGREVIKE